MSGRKFGLTVVPEVIGVWKKLRSVPLNGSSLLRRAAFCSSVNLKPARFSITSIAQSRNGFVSKLWSLSALGSARKIPTHAAPWQEDKAADRAALSLKVGRR